MKVLGIIPARGGSKGVPRKNIRMLAGSPLIAYTIESAQRSVSLTRLVVSTEDNEIAEVSKRLGCEVVKRPPELATDSAPTLPVVQHAIEDAENRFEPTFDAICLLQPTCPLRTPQHIDDCIELFRVSNCDSVISVSRIPDKYHPNWAFVEEQELLQHAVQRQTFATRRQDLAPAYFRNGMLYLVSRRVLLEENSLYGERIKGFPIPIEDAVNIDTDADWKQAESALLQRN